MFENIFSKEKLENIERIKIVVDHREKNSLVIAELSEIGIDSEMQHLAVADFLVKDVAIERKTVSDFLSSMINKRLIQQLEDIKQYPNYLLLIEGLAEKNLYNDNEKDLINPNAVRGFLLSILLKYKVPIIFTKNEADTAKFISVLAKKQDSEMGIRAKKISRDKKETLQFLLEGFPGIGPKTAKKLLEKYKTIKNIINTPQEELEKEIGKKSEIFNLLDEEY